MNSPQTLDQAMSLNQVVFENNLYADLTNNRFQKHLAKTGNDKFPQHKETVLMGWYRIQSLINKRLVKFA